MKTKNPKTHSKHSLSSAVERANSYVDDVLAGRIPACKWVKLACARHVDNLKAAANGDYPYRFDENLAEARVQFLEAFPHTKGKWALNRAERRDEPWQCFLTVSLFGWVHKATGLRRFNEALIVVPRKNGKSDWAARIALSGIADQSEYGAEIYIGATTEKQAWEVFMPAKRMALAKPEFLSLFGIEVMASNISVPARNARMQPLIGKPGDGSSPSMAIHDEYHEHADDDQVDTMKTGMLAREQPLQLFITTAGSNLAGPCYSAIVEARKMLEGIHKSERLFFIEYTIDDDDNWTDPAVLAKANPNFGVSISAEFLLEEQQKAIRDARKQSVFQTKHLNKWVGAKTAFFNVEQWRACGNLALKIEDFKGLPCKIGLDLAVKIDIAALEIVFKTKTGFARFGRYYLPRETVDNAPSEHYRTWERQGLLTVTDGNVLDDEKIIEDIIDLAKTFKADEVAYDPYHATIIANILTREGVGMVEVGQTVPNFAKPMRDLEGLIASKRIEHDGDPIMTWMISNVIAKEDNKGNVYPNKDKKQPQNKIDGVIALLMALARYGNETTDGPSVYEDRGIIFI